MAISDENRKEEEACRCVKILTKAKFPVPVGAGMFLFSFLGEARIYIRGTPCLAKNDTAFKAANNSRSSDNCPVNLRLVKA